MDTDRLTDFAYAVKKNGVPGRGRFQLWVNLPPEPLVCGDDFTVVR